MENRTPDVNGDPPQIRPNRQWISFAGAYDLTDHVSSRPEAPFALKAERLSNRENRNIILSRQKFCRRKHAFVATKDMFCQFVATKFLSRQQWYLWQLPLPRFLPRCLSFQAPAFSARHLTVARFRGCPASSDSGACPQRGTRLLD